MTGRDDEAIRQAFERLLEQPEAERVAFVAREYGIHATMGRRLLAMLASLDDGRPSTQAPARGDAPASHPAAQAHEGPGTRIGRYEIVEQIGEGGFGVVFRARQEKPVRREVALKIIKLGMDTRQVVARFEQERQALALMDHPHVARVIDAGATAAGRPYFVMELVQGVPITRFCDERRLAIAARLGLFEQVCMAVQHAHAKGLIHRDIKPSNILVGDQDGQPHAKVIDFGIAKATSARLTDSTLLTEEHQVVGTLQYMSPEQALGSLDIDTRSDVYALGVVLYELLTGSTPFAPEALRGAMYADVQRMIAEDQPPRPSTRLRQSAEVLATIAERRRVEPQRLGSLLHGELDWIVMKALEKDRSRRYGSAAELAADVRRHLLGEPVVAAPPSAAYRARKFVRRHRGAVTAAALVLASLVLGIVGTATQAARADAGRDEAVAAREAESKQRAEADAQRELADARRAEAEVQRNRAVAAEAEAVRRADELQRVADFQAAMLGGIDVAAAGAALTGDVRARHAASLAKAGLPDEERARLVEEFANAWSLVNATDAARELVDATILRPAVEAVDERFADQPVVAARLRGVLAERYSDLGLDERALELALATVDQRRAALGDEHRDTLEALGQVGQALADLGRHDEAASYLVEALEAGRRVLGDDDPVTLDAIARMGQHFRAVGRPEAAEPLLREALEGRRRVLGEDDPYTLASLEAWGMVCADKGRYEEAEQVYREALDARRRVLGPDGTDTLQSLSDLAVVLEKVGRREESVVLLREIVAARRRALGDVHPLTLSSMQNLGTSLTSLGRTGEAEALMREAFDDQRRLLGADHPSTLNTQSNLAVLLIDQGRLAEAEALCRDSLERRRRTLGEDHRATLVGTNVLGYVLRSRGRTAEALTCARKTVEISRRALGAGHPDTFLYMHNLARLLLDLGERDEGEALLLEVVRDGGAALGADQEIVLSARGELAHDLVGRGRDEEAVELLAPMVDEARAARARGASLDVARWLRNLGIARTRLGDFAAAEGALLEARDLVSDAASVRSAEKLLVDFYTAWNAVEPGAGHEAQVERWKAASAGAGSGG